MKSLIPSHKENKRYLLIQGENIKINIEKSILEFVGINGFSKIGLSWIESKKKSAIICINRESVNEVRASFCMYPKEIKTTKISGTLKGLRK